MMNSCSVAERINSQVNDSVQYKTDLEQYSTPEFWVEAGTFGIVRTTHYSSGENCLRVPLIKKKDLMLARCWCVDGSYHFVLLLNTDNGWFSLDNRFNLPKFLLNVGIRGTKVSMKVMENGTSYRSNTVVISLYCGF